MHRINDYFLLFHGNVQKHSNALQIKHNLDDDTFFEISALILCMKNDNFEKISQLPSFHTLLEKLTPLKVTTKETLYHLQYSILLHFIEHINLTNMQHFHNAFEYLQEEGIISKESCKKLISLFEPHQTNEDKEIPLIKHSELDTLDFHTQKEYIVTIINELQSYFKNRDELEEISRYIQKQKFSIGITGVMNAGKSTMLNALMGREILGTNVIPETANLSIVKYSDTPYVNVSYWNTKEWQSIETSAKNSSAIAEFVQEAKERFGETLENYIEEVSRIETIEIESLREYTSASSKSSVYQLVKSVEIGSDLSFLQNAIEIVDTPGLDDVVVQRETITKEYVSECDLMIHLMNVSQSATHKDIAFIIDAVLFQNISKVLIVITRIDSVSEKEVQEVVAYTKSSIAKELKEQNSDAKLDYILDTLHFIPLSGKMALLHKTARAEEALSQGYSLEKSGMLELESYLQETLFGGDRTALIIATAKKSLKRLVDEELTSLELSLSMLDKNEDELEFLLKELQTQKEKATQKTSRVREQITAYEEELKLFMNIQLTYLNNELKRLEELIKERVMSEARFSFEKEKKPPQKKRLKRIVDDTLKHGLLDIIREFRYRLLKQFSKVLQALQAQNSEIIDKNFDIESLFSEAFKKSFLTTSYENLSEELTQLFTSSSLKKLQTLELKVNETIKTNLSDLDSLVESKATTLSQELQRDFFNYLKEPLKILENSFERDELLIQEHIQNSRNDADSKEIQKNEISKKIKAIQLIASRCR